MKEGKTNTSALDERDQISSYQLWLQHLDLREESMRTYVKALADFENWTNENGITQPNETTIKMYRDDLAHRINPRTGDAFSPSTIRLYVGTVKRFFAWASKKGLCEDIAWEVRLPNLSAEHKKDYFTSAQVRTLLGTAAGDSEKAMRDHAILQLMVTTGLRTCEVSRAKIEDLRPRGDMTVLYVLGKGRDAKTEYVQIPPALETSIRTYLSARHPIHTNEPLFAPVGARKKTHLRAQTISHICKEYMRQAGVDDARHTAHSLRHTTATLALLSGANIEEVKGLMRHTSVNTTLIYSHALEAQSNRSASLVEQRILNNNSAPDNV